MAAVTAPTFDAVYGVKEAALCNAALSRIGGELILSTTETTAQARLCRAAYAATRNELLRAFPFAFSIRSAMVNEDTDYLLPSGDYLYAFKAENHEAFTGDSDTVALIETITGITVDNTLIGMEVSGTDIPAGARIISIDDTVGAETITLDRATTGTVTAFEINIPVLKVLIANHDADVKFEVVGSGEDKRILCNDIGDVNDDGGNLLEIKYISEVIDPDEFDPMFADALVARIASKIVMPLTKSVQLKQLADQEFAAVFYAAKVASSEERQPNQHDLWWSDRQAIGASPYSERD